MKARKITNMNHKEKLSDEIIVVIAFLTIVTFMGSLIYLDHQGPSYTATTSIITPLSK